MPGKCIPFDKAKAKSSWKSLTLLVERLSMSRLRYSQLLTWEPSKSQSAPLQIFFCSNAHTCNSEKKCACACCCWPMSHKRKVIFNIRNLLVEFRYTHTHTHKGKNKTKPKNHTQFCTCFSDGRTWLTHAAWKWPRLNLSSYLVWRTYPPLGKGLPPCMTVLALSDTWYTSFTGMELHGLQKHDTHLAK